MHELGIATSVIEAVRTEAALHAPCRVMTIGLRIGDLAAVDESSLRFCFDVLVRDTDFASTALCVEHTPGHELDLAYMELEDEDGANSARAQGSE